MNKYITLVISVGFLSACTSIKEATPQKIDAIEQRSSETMIDERASELLVLFKKYDIDVSVREQAISPEGRLVLTVNETASFVDGATILIYPDWFSDLDQVARRMKMTMDISKNNAKKRFVTMAFPEGNDVPVTYEK
jgi:hypothetical protein